MGEKETGADPGAQSTGAGLRTGSAAGQDPGVPQPAEGTIVKSKSNITNN